MANFTLNSGIFLIFCQLTVTLTATGKVSRKPTNENCMPTPSARTMQYLVGYGSLMAEGENLKVKDDINGDSPTIGEIFPVEIKGFRREWNAKFKPTLKTFLGAVPDQNSTFNGAIFRLFNDSTKNWSNADVLGLYDSREVIYCRFRLESKNFQILGGKNVPELRDANKNPGPYEIWIYVTQPEFLHRPNKNFPIRQSYVDTFLSGCFELEEKFGLENFADQCVESTGGWNQFWVNDRDVLNRSANYPPRTLEIDRLLDEKVPAFSRRSRLQDL